MFSVRLPTPANVSNAANSQKASLSAAGSPSRAATHSPRKVELSDHTLAGRQGLIDNTRQSLSKNNANYLQYLEGATVLEANPSPRCSDLQPSKSMVFAGGSGKLSRALILPQFLASLTIFCRSTESCCHKPLKEQRVYTSQHHDNNGLEVVAIPIDEVLAASEPDDLHAFLTMGQRIVSPGVIGMTLTANGYEAKQDDVDAFSNYINGRIAADQFAGLLRDKKVGTMSVLTAALYSYFDAGAKESSQPPLLLSFDNVANNGDQLYKTIKSVIESCDIDIERKAEFLAWFNHNLKCPNTMVDRVVPKTGSRE